VILRRLPDSRFSEVVSEWKGRTVAILGGGPSLTMDQVETVRMANMAGLLQCIAVNDSYLAAPWADLLYAADAKWHEWHRQGIAKPALGLNAAQVALLFKSFAGQKCSIATQQNRITDEATHVLKNKNGNKHGSGISLDPQYIVTGRQSGYQALNVAILAGASNVLLLGFDGKVLDGRTHWHGGHPETTQAGAWQSYARAWTDGQHAIRATGVRIINCSLQSSIGLFEKMPLEQALCVATQ
jgi:hypothetical protein